MSVITATFTLSPANAVGRVTLPGVPASPLSMQVGATNAPGPVVLAPATAPLSLSLTPFLRGEPGPQGPPGSGGGDPGDIDCGTFN